MSAVTRRVTTSAIDRWTRPPGVPRLHTQEVHVWRIFLDAPRIERHEAVLDAGERRRASRFRSDIARTRYIAARGTLRDILGRYLDMPPERLAFEYNAFGKPSLADRCNASDLRFNVTHAGSMGLFAVTCGRDVGIDVEERVASVSTEHIAAEFFSPLEVAALGRLPASVRARAFFACWTRKEAYIKARGQGLSFPLDRFSVNVSPDAPPRLLTADEPTELARWSMAGLAVGDPFEATVVAETPDWTLQCWDWTEPAL